MRLVAAVLLALIVAALAVLAASAGGAGSPPLGAPIGAADTGHDDAAGLPVERAVETSAPRSEIDPTRGELRGVVRWSDGRRIDRCSVKCRSRFPLDPVTLAARTGADGAFRFESLAFGPWQLEVEHGDSPARRALEIEIDGPSREVALTLPLGLSIDGRVDLARADGGSRPLRHGSVYAFAPGVNPARGRVAPDGAFHVGGLLPGSYELVYWENRLELVSRAIVAAGARGVRLVARRGRSTVRGDVVDERGEPIPRFTVDVFQTLAGRRIRRRSEQAQHGSFEVAELPPGVYECVIRATGRRPFRAEAIELGDGESVDIDAILSPLAPIDGRVLDAAGRAIEGADVFVLGPLEEPVVDMGTVIDVWRLAPHQARLGTARTGPGGRFRMPGMLATRALAVAHPHRGRLEWRVEGTISAPLGSRLENGVTVRGRLVGILGKSERELLLVPQGDAPGHRAEHAGSRFNGAFEFAGVGRGRWELYFRGFEQAMLLRRFVVVAGDVDLGAIELDGPR